MKFATLLLLAVLSLGAEEIAPNEEGKPIKVALFVGDGSSSGCVKKLSRILREDPKVRMRPMNASDVRTGVLQQYDVLIIPGGYASRQGRAIGKKGSLAVRAFVEGGGGYLGICAGAYLAGSRHPTAFNLIADGDKIDSPPRKKVASGKQSSSNRGKLLHKQRITLTEKGKAIFPDQPASFQIVCVAGPTFAATGAVPLSYDVLATFQTQLETGRGAVINDAGIVSSQFGKGRVLAISPHPELTGGLEEMVSNAVRWVAEPQPTQGAVPAHN